MERVGLKRCAPGLAGGRRRCCRGEAPGPLPLAPGLEAGLQHSRIFNCGVEVQVSGDTGGFAWTGVAPAPPPPPTLAFLPPVVVGGLELFLSLT